jgi:hypothetical protein
VEELLHAQCADYRRSNYVLLDAERMNRVGLSCIQFFVVNECGWWSLLTSDFGELVHLIATSHSAGIVSCR